LQKNDISRGIITRHCIDNLKKKKKKTGYQKYYRITYTWIKEEEEGNEQVMAMEEVKGEKEGQ
jgi:hypothetical protein